MIGFVREKLLCLLVILSNVLNFSPEEKRAITALYKDKETIRGEYDMLKSTNSNKCQEQLPRWHPAELPIKTRREDIRTVIVTVPEGSTVVTLDDINQFDIPAYIECVINGDGGHFMMLTGIGQHMHKSTITKIIKHTTKIHNKDLFMTLEVSVVRILNIAYIDTDMTSIYAAMARPQNKHTALCGNIQVRQRLPYEYILQIGFMQLGKYSLHLNQFQTVSLPGVLICMFDIWSVTNVYQSKVLYFVADLKLKDWFQVYTFDTSDPTVNINQSFALETYLLENYQG